jgi:hypothetical protein
LLALILTAPQRRAILPTAEAILFGLGKRFLWRQFRIKAFLENFIALFLATPFTTRLHRCAFLNASNDNGIGITVAIIELPAVFETIMGKRGPLGFTRRLAHIRFRRTAQRAFLMKPRCSLPAIGLIAPLAEAIIVINSGVFTATQLATRLRPVWLALFHAGKKLRRTGVTDIPNLIIITICLF